MEKHTELPWRVTMEMDGVCAGWKTWVIDSNGFGVAVCNNQTRRGVFRANKEESEASAQLIVTAVNNHARLIEFIQYAIDRSDVDEKDWVLEAHVLLDELGASK